MRVLQVTGAYPPATSYTGPPGALHRLCRELLSQDVRVRVVTTDADGPRRAPVATGGWTEHEEVPVFYGRRWGRDGTFSPSFLRAVWSAVGESDVAHTTAVYGWARAGGDPAPP